MNKKSLLLTLILLTIFSAISTLALLAAKKITGFHPNAVNTPDFFMTNAVYVKFDQDGHISNQFYTSKITHFTTQNNYIFDNPNMKIYNANEAPWNITATKGRSEWGKSKIYLWDNVRVTQTSGTNNADFDITTTALSVYPNIKYAETNEPITIMQSGSIAKAIGAKADFKAGVVNLLSNVECQYQAD